MIVPVRGAPVAFAAALNVTVALPVPEPALVTANQSPLFDVAVHAHDAPVVSMKEPAPPAAAVA